MMLAKWRVEEKNRKLSIESTVSDFGSTWNGSTLQPIKFKDSKIFESSDVL